MCGNTTSRQTYRGEGKVVHNKATQIIVCSDVSQVVEQAAELFVARANAAVAATGRFTVALSGCVTPMALNRLLSTEPFSGRLPWDRIHVFWTDEICAPSSDQQSRYHSVHEVLLAHVPIPEANVYPPPTGHLDCRRAASEYERSLRAFFDLGTGELPRFDFIWLELGADGHTASLFPDSSAVEENTRLVVASYIKQLGEHRLTLTVPVLSNAAVVVFLVAGENRATALHEALSGAYRPSRLPSQLIRPSNGELFYFVEQRASVRLRGSPAAPRAHAETPTGAHR